MNAKKIYITSAIPYVNAAPHIGHAQEFVYADTIRRYHALLGKDVTYLCGADENALKIFQAAEKAGQTPQQFTDTHNSEFLDVANRLNVTFDIWQRGSDAIHHFSSSQKLWSLCEKNGDIYKKSYSGLYCVGCETFYTPDELNEQGECFEHPGRKLDHVSEENYFFRLSKYQDFLADLITNDTLKIFPEFRKNEALGFIKKGLEDFSISRSKERARGWGISVPNDPNQIMYVWFDALNIYQTGVGFGLKDESTYDKLAPQDVMVIGKGIIRFHAIYWPAILQSAGLKLPKELFVHGYLTVDGQKMSKTVGNVVDPLSVVAKYGSDAVRYYLLKEIPSYSDGDYSERRFKELYNADLANGLGNLFSRVMKLATTEDWFEKPEFNTVINKPFRNAMREYKFDLALQIIWDKIREADKFINTNQPWKLTGHQQEEIINSALHMLLDIATMLQPFLPKTAAIIISGIQGLYESSPSEIQLTGSEKSDSKPHLPSLFPRIP